MNWIAVRFFLFLLLVISLILISVLVSLKFYKPKDKTIDYLKFSADVSKSIDEVGPETAYSEFKKHYADDKYLPVRHAAAHIMGVALYKKIGIQGITICDQSFFYGCFHGFMAEVIFQSGTSSLKALDEICVKKFGVYSLVCPHGIGHGILGFLGKNNIAEALILCESLPHKYPIGGCPEGVFMEYNFTTDHNTGVAASRSIKSGEIYAPCDLILDKFKEACYMDQGQWWILSMESKKVAELCASLPSKNLKESCFMGMGRAAPDANSYDKKKTLSACRSAGKNEALCRAGALITFLSSSPEDPTDFFCGDLNTENKTICLEKAKFLKPVSGREFFPVLK